MESKGKKRKRSENPLIVGGNAKSRSETLCFNNKSCLDETKGQYLLLVECLLNRSPLADSARNVVIVAVVASHT